MKSSGIRVIVLLSFAAVFSGCYTYLSLSSGAKLADTHYEEILYSPPCCPNPPAPPPYSPVPYCPVIVIVQPVPQPYERPEQIINIRNGGDTKIPETGKKKR